MSRWIEPAERTATAAGCESATECEAPASIIWARAGARLSDAIASVREQLRNEDAGVMERPLTGDEDVVDVAEMLSLAVHPVPSDTTAARITGIG